MKRGPALLLLHGFTGSPACWDEVLSFSSAPRDVLRPALAGHDPSVPAPASGAAPTWESEVDRIAGLVPPELTGRVHVCGYSAGGRLALGLLVRHAALFCSATLVSAQPGLVTEEERASRRKADEVWAELATREGLPRFVDRWESQALFATQATLPPAVLEAQRTRRLRHTAAGMALALRTFGLAEMPNYWPALADLRLPVSVVVGAKDAKFLAIGQRMVQALPEGTLVALAGLGHNVVLEGPEALARVLERAA